MNKRNKSLIALLLVLCVGLVGLTIAYFSNSDTIENQFITKEYGTTYTEEFVSPDSWLPGDTTDKTIVATNSGQVDEAVRISLSETWTPNKTGSTLNGWIHQDGTKSTHESASELENDERVAVINFDNDSDWYYEDGYYYYKYKLAPNESTTSLIKSVTFNPNTKLDDTCITTEGNGTKTITCNSSGEDYDHATYTLTFTVETVQYNKYAEAWQLPQNTTIAIASSKPQGVNFAQAIMSKSNAATITNYTDGVTTEAYTFEHGATEQTPALTDYRYIGASPNNYVEFNCDDNGENCEIWRAIGVFKVDDGNNNWEWRVKLVRGSSFEEPMSWDINRTTDWTNSSLKTFLNEDYYNASGDAEDYGLKESAQEMIDNAVYYLGTYAWANTLTTEQIYTNERGNESCFDCNNDLTKLNWTGKISLMYSSDYGYIYALGVEDNCYNDLHICNIYDNRNPLTGWFYDNYGVTDLDVWLLSPFTDFDYVSSIRAEGFIGITYGDHSDVLRAIFPVVYLNTNTYIIDGDGSVDHPYKLSL